MTVLATEHCDFAALDFESDAGVDQGECEQNNEQYEDEDASTDDLLMPRHGVIIFDNVNERHSLTRGVLTGDDIEHLHAVVRNVTESIAAISGIPGLDFGDPTRTPGDHVVRMPETGGIAPPTWTNLYDLEQWLINCSPTRGELLSTRTEG